MSDNETMTVELSEYHAGMLEELRKAHGGEIDQYLDQLVASEIHESFQQLQTDGPALDGRQ